MCFFKKSWFFLLGIGILLGLIAADYWIFTIVFKRSFLEWYLCNGSFIILMTSILGIFWKDIDSNLNLISWNPFIYISANLELCGKPFLIIGNRLRLLGQELIDRANTLYQDLNASIIPVFARCFEVISCTVTGVIICSIAVGWFLFIVPIQYFIYLVCGALPRALSSDLIDEKTENQETKTLAEANHVSEVVSESSNSIKSINRPVSLTALLSAAFILLLKLVFLP